MVFFLVVLVISGVATAAELVLRCTMKIKNFAHGDDWIKFKGKTIPIEDFLPENVFPLIIFLFAFSAAGMILDALGIPFVIAIFCGIIFAALFNYMRKHFFKKLYLKLRGEFLPKNKPDTGDKARCSQDILNGGYGEIEFVYKNRSWFFPAMSANETDILKGEETTVVYKEQGICWVEKPEEELSED